MSHGDRVTRLPPGFRAVGVQRGRALRRHRRRRAALLRRAVPSRGRPHAARRAALAQFHPRRRRPGRRLDDGRVPRRGDRAHPRAGRRGAGDLRPVGRGRFAVAAVLIHEAIGDQLTCIFVDHGLLRQGEAEEVVGTVPRPVQHPAGASRRVATLFLAALDGRRPTPRRSARPSAGCSSTCSRRKRRRLGGARVPRAGHALSRRDRERELHRRPERHDQVAPQCRRPARADAHEAGRAVARTVQGRGARARPRAWPAGGIVGRHPFPGPGPRDPHPRRDHAARSSTCCGGPMRSISRRSARPGSTTRSGRLSRCCCRCAPSA